MAHNYMFCIDCHWQGPTNKKARGTILIEIVLWSFVVIMYLLFGGLLNMLMWEIIAFAGFLIPALMYSLWRLTSRRYICPACGHETMIPNSSPRAQDQIEIYLKRDSDDLL